MNMLNQIFGSKARVKILKLFLLNPDERYFIRQLARDLKLQVNSVRRELENLEKFGLLLADPSNFKPADRQLLELDLKGLSGDEERLARIEEFSKPKKPKVGDKRQDKKYYQVNKKFVLYPEIRALIIKSQILSGYSFIKKLQKLCQPKLLLLTGLFINQSSPTDILLVGRIKKEKLSKIINELEQDLGREVNYTTMGLTEFKYRQEIADIFIYNILREKNIILVNEIKK